MNNWIKVSDRLPEEREQVLIRYWNGQIHTGARFGNKWHSNWNDYDIGLATHWMSIEFTEEDFNSQICTTRAQSERLLALGLKKETADMTWKFSYLMKGVPRYDCLAESTWDEETIARYVHHCGLMNLTEHWKHSDGTQMSSEDVYAEITKKDIPAWSLHRLIEMMPTTIKSRYGYVNLAVNAELVQYQYYDEDYMRNECFQHFNDGTLYDNLIDCIEWLIKEGYFNKEYLV